MNLLPAIIIILIAVIVTRPVVLALVGLEANWQLRWTELLMGVHVEPENRAITICVLPCVLLRVACIRRGRSI